MIPLEISVIISTYNAVEWLQKTLEGYKVQTFKNFEIIIADDGSTVETAKVIKEISRDFPVPIKHVWHKDKGFRKTQILNKAILASTADYLLMTDGDCIPRNDFVKVHHKFREKNYFLSGGYFKLPMELSKQITKEDILSQDCFDIKWLTEKGLNRSFKNNKISARGKKSTVLNWITPTNASWNGHNSSGWKADILAVNGFDERMQYGGEDRELGERLFNYGIKSKQIRYSAICLHLDHARGYVNQEAMNKNKAIRQSTKRNKIIKTPFGLKQRNYTHQV